MISAIVLSAGKSSRMGSINKMLLPFGKSSMIGTVVSNLTVSDVDEIIVVENAESKISEHLEPHPKVQLIINNEANKGLTSSIQCGVRSSNKKSDAYLVCLGDMPLITTEEYNLLINSILESTKESIHIPYFNSKKGNPVLFSSHFKEEILDLKDSNGCRPVVQENQDSVKQIIFPTDHCLRDIDTMDDYKKLNG